MLQGREGERVMSNKLGIDFPMFEQLRKKLESIEGQALDKAVDKALKESNAYIASQLETAMQPHNKTGKTESSLLKNTEVLKTGTEYSANTGFKISAGGLPSIFLMYGTKVHGQPHVKPDKKLYNALYGPATKKKIQEIQANAFFETIDEVMKK